MGKTKRNKLKNNNKNTNSDPNKRKESVKSNKRKNSEEVSNTFISKISKKSPSPLVNMGASCYLNSAFQGISACVSFVKEISLLYENNKEYKLIQLELFKELIDIINNCSRNEIDISKNPIFHNWNKEGQQDSYELLAYALNQVYNEIRKQKENSGEIPKKDLKIWLMVKLPMRYTIQYSIICSCGAPTFSPLQSDFALHINIPNEKKKYKLNELLDLYFDYELIEDYKCDKKNCTERSAKRIARLSIFLPMTFCIHLQRTYWNGDSMNKVNKVVEFSIKLIIKSKFVIEEVAETLTVSNDVGNIANEEPINSINNPCTENISMINKQFENITVKDKLDLANMTATTLKEVSEDALNKKDNTNKIKEQIPEVDRNRSHVYDKVYDLVSVIEHSGIVSSGHYVCYKKVDTKWFKTDDNRVSEVSEDAVLKCQAYILFYEKV